MLLFYFNLGWRFLDIFNRKKELHYFISSANHLELQTNKLQRYLFRSKVINFQIFDIEALG